MKSKTTRSKKRKFYLIGIAVFLIVIQLFRIDKSVPEPKPQNDFLELTNPTAEIGDMIKNSCYDCHSYQTKYPWYAEIAPVSWMLKRHINEGRQHLNFSEWGFYSAKKANRKLEESAELIEYGAMPLSSYTLMHKSAKLSSEQVNQLSSWIKSLGTGESEGHDDD